MIERLLDQIKRTQAELALSLARGNASNIESYRQLSGEYIGYEKVLNMIDDILKENEQDEQ